MLFQIVGQGIIIGTQRWAALFPGFSTPAFQAPPKGKKTKGSQKRFSTSIVGRGLSNHPNGPHWPRMAICHM